MQGLCEPLLDQSGCRVLLDGAPNRKGVSMGVYRRGKFWHIRYQDPDGKIVRESTRQESKRTAEDILRKRKTEIAEGRYLDKLERPKMTFHELCDWYWEHHGQFKR